MRPPEPIVHSAEPPNQEWPVSSRNGWLTPAVRFFERNHFRLPEPAAAPWSLTVTGSVSAPLTLSLRELRRLGSDSLWVTLECSGNKRAYFDPRPEGEPWREGAVGNAEWTGLPLRTLLLRAGYARDAAWVRFTGADFGRHQETGLRTHFERALPLTEAMRPEVLLVWAMNGEPLPHRHGGPLRLIVPDWYGMASVKWLTGIEVRTEPFRGPFQVRDYVYLPEPGAYDRAEPVTRGRVQSVITEPADGARVAPGNLLVRGLAWSGMAEVERVDISPDGGSTWQSATLEEPVARHAWRRWACLLTGVKPGSYRIMARATDRAGNVQPWEAQWNAKGYGHNQVSISHISVTSRPTERS